MITHLVSSIAVLLKEHGTQIKAFHSLSHSQSVDVPTQFLCPISKEIMKDPVIAACDGNTYERENIENYLKQHNKSPVTGAVAAVSMVFPNNTVKKMIDEFMSANSHNMQDQNESEQEGVVE